MWKYGKSHVRRSPETRRSDEDVYVSTATQSSLEKTTAEYKVKGSLDNLVVADYLTYWYWQSNHICTKV